jgi:hypothetical protein
VGNGPQEAHQFPCNSHDHLVGMFPAGQQASIAFAQPHLGLPTDVLDGFGLCFQSQLQMAADFGGILIGPSAFNDGPTRMGLAGCGDGPLPASLATGIF